MRAAAAVVLAAALGAAGCASLPAGSVRNERDPFERFNRGVFAFNDAVDRAVTKPLAQAYRAVVPAFVRGYVGNFFSNIGDVFIAVNQLLQGKPADAASDAGRVVVNTVFGFGGLVDLASDLGMRKHAEDFGQTFGRWGVPDGPYLVLPIFGPSNIRDTVGWAFDTATYPLVLVDDTAFRNGSLGLRIVDTRERLLDAERVVEGAALDRYSFLRDAYLQRRRSQVWDGNPPDEAGRDERVPVYEDDPEGPAAAQEAARPGTSDASRNDPLPGGSAVPSMPVPMPGQPPFRLGR